MFLTSQMSVNVKTEKKLDNNYFTDNETVKTSKIRESYKNIPIHKIGTNKERLEFD